MKSLLEKEGHQEILDRIARLGPDSERRWGTMSVEEMLNHLGRQLQMGLGEIEAPPVGGPYSLPGVRNFAICVMPWPKGVKTAPQLLPESPARIDEERERLLEVIAKFVERGEKGPSFAPHALFGRLSGSLWGKLAYRHLDHHLTQFSC